MAASEGQSNGSKASPRVDVASSSSQLVPSQAVNKQKRTAAETLDSESTSDGATMESDGSDHNQPAKKAKHDASWEKSSIQVECYFFEGPDHVVDIKCRLPLPECKTLHKLDFHVSDNVIPRFWTEHLMPAAAGRSDISLESWYRVSPTPTNQRTTLRSSSTRTVIITSEFIISGLTTTSRRAGRKR
jgi:hypothetical protein